VGPGDRRRRACSAGGRTEREARRTAAGVQGVIYGIAIIAIILLAPEGIYWRIRDRLASRLAEPSSMPGVNATIPAVPREVRSRTADNDLLVLRDIGISFGGLRALDGVDLRVREGGLYGIIGPNGAGKTTLFNVINGFLSPARGSISFAGERLVGLRPNQVCRLGIGRTFQVVRAFPRMTVLENVTVGAFVRAANDAAARRMAGSALDRVGLSARANALAGGLTNRELRLMELARALAPQPRLILLGETLAGLGHEDLEGILSGLVARMGDLAARGGGYRRVGPFLTPDRHRAIQNEPRSPPSHPEAAA
jgi:ABC-type branched-subunit amino acid transport system ATPase component